MTQPKILYSFIEGQQRFFVVPELPPYPNTCTGCSPGHACAECNEKYDNWKYECDRIKSTAPEIVNPEEISQCLNIQTGYPWSDGDTFDLPNGLELREQLQVSHSVDKSTWYDVKDTEPSVPDKCYRKVFRIVKTELKRAEIDKEWSNKLFGIGEIIEENDGVKLKTKTLEKIIEYLEVKPEPESQENMMQELLQEYRNLRKRKATQEAMKQLPKASRIIDKYFSYNDLDKKRVSEMMQEYTRLVLDYVAENKATNFQGFDIVESTEILKVKDQLL